MILICGLPNSGKTSYSARYDDVLHYDEFRLNTRERYQRIIQIAQEEPDICIEGVYGEARRRAELVKAVKPNKAICIWLNTPVEECVKRENRSRPTGIVLAPAQKFQPPTMDEGWDEIIVIDNTKGNK